MYKKPYSDLITEKYIEDNLENSSKIDFTELKDPFLEKHLYKDLPNTVVKGFPFSSDFVDKDGKSYSFKEFGLLSPEKKKECELRYYYLPFFHELYIGTTGSGKTTGCIEPQIRAISSQKNKPNMFITDPKGELFEHHATHLKNMGYNVYILNFRNFAKSNCWNPLEEMYLKQMEILDIGKGYEIKEGYPSEGVELYDKSESYKGRYYLYENKAFSNKESFERYLDVIEYMKHSEVSSLVNQVATCVFPPNNANDPTWGNGSKALFHGILLTMLEEASKPNTSFTKKMMTLKTVNDIFALTQSASESRDDDMKLEDFLRGKSSEARNKLATVIDTAPQTKKGFLSTFQSEVSKWMQGHIFQLTCETNVSTDDSKKPFAIFVSTRDYDKSDNIIAGLFIDWTYRQVLKSVEEKREKGLSVRDTHFLLDEFANIPRIPDFETKIATARSRNIWFHLFVQSYDQLVSVYEKEIAPIIIDNCNQQTFLGSQSHDTKKKFSEECGNKTIPSLQEIFNPNSKGALNQVPVIPVADLDLIEPGEMYVKRIYSEVIKGQFIRSYQCANVNVYQNFYGTRPFEYIAPFNSNIPDEPSRLYNPILPHWYTKRKPRKRDIKNLEVNMVTSDGLSVGINPDEVIKSIKFDDYYQKHLKKK